MAGDAKFLLVDQLSDGELEAVPIGIAVLLVRWHRIVYLRFHAVDSQKPLKIIATPTKNWEYMPHAVGLTNRNRQTKEWILHLINIYTRDILTAVILFVEIAELHIEHGRLELVDTRITTLIVVNILLMATIITYRPHYLCEFQIIGRHCPSITQSAEIFPRIEAMTSGIPQRTSSTISKCTALCLCIIFDEFQTMLLANLPAP